MIGQKKENKKEKNKSGRRLRKSGIEERSTWQRTRYKHGGFVLCVLAFFLFCSRLLHFRVWGEEYVNSRKGLTCGHDGGGHSRADLDARMERVMHYRGRESKSSCGALFSGFLFAIGPR